MHYGQFEDLPGSAWAFVDVQPLPMAGGFLYVVAYGDGALSIDGEKA